jgi:hypothetical protein
LILKQADLYLNLCPETIEYFKTSSEKRNLLEYLRNKTLHSGQLFYLLNDTHTLKGIASLSSFENNFVSGSEAEDAIAARTEPFSSSENHIFIM